ncbi:MAG: hypothetical protein ACRCVG_05400 [Methanobacteriaceae archaeon]
MDKSRNYQPNIDITRNITNNETYESKKLVIAKDNDNYFNMSNNKNNKGDVGSNNVDIGTFNNDVGSINDIINEVQKTKGKNSISGSKINNSNYNINGDSENINISDNKKNNVYSNILPIRKAIPLFALTGGLYFYYWFYKNVKNIQEYHNVEMSPKLSTICLFIPVLNFIIIYDLFKKMEGFIADEGIESYSSVLMIITVILLLFSFLFIPLTIFLTFWPYLNVQESFNEYWLKKEPNLPIKRSFSDGELLVLILGGFVFSIFALVLFTILFSLLTYPFA